MIGDDVIYYSWFYKYIYDLKQGDSFEIIVQSNEDSKGLDLGKAH